MKSGLISLIFFFIAAASKTSHASNLLGWTILASNAAEAAARYHCSGHGNLFIDTYHPDNHSICECFECFTGPYCANPIPDCDADVESGDPLLFEPFWKQNAKESAVVIPGWYRMSYKNVEATNYILTPALEREIRLLHKLVRNAVTDGRYIVLGTGSTQLLNAAVSSVAPDRGKAADVVAAVPYYNDYEAQTKLFETRHYAWSGNAYHYARVYHSREDSSIEFVTSPNNPDNFLQHAIVNGRKAYRIYDHAYLWPHFTAITDPSDHDVMLFTLSKVTGHAGTRIGWAIVRDKGIYARMANYVSINTLGVAHESQLRATQILKVVNRGYSKLVSRRTSLDLEPMQYAKEKLIFHYAYAKLKCRWEALSKVLQGSNFRLQHLEPMYNPFFKQVSQPSPAYAWIQCQGTETNCSNIFPRAGIKGRIGSMYGSNYQHIRFSLLKRDSNFNNLIERLTTLISKK